MTEDDFKGAEGVRKYKSYFLGHGDKYAVSYRDPGEVPENTEGA